MSSTQIGVAFMKACVVAASLACGVAMAAKPWVGVPSATTAQRLIVAGGDFQPWQALTLRVTYPSGQQSLQSATADAKGVLAAEVATAAAGAYRVEVFDTAGQRLGLGRFAVNR